MDEPLSMSLPAGLSAATRIVDRLKPFTRRIEIAGSIRRRRAVVNDIDLVIETDDRLRVIDLVKARGGAVVSGDSANAQNTICRLGRYQLDLFFTRPRSTDLFDTAPCNFGSVLLCRTGSKTHNIFIVEQAKKLGLTWAPLLGVFNEKKELIASETEEEIYAALHLPFLDPAKDRDP